MKSSQKTGQHVPGPYADKTKYHFKRHIRCSGYALSVARKRKGFKRKGRESGKSPKDPYENKKSRFGSENRPFVSQPG
jgi:hypothetical protein